MSQAQPQITQDTPAWMTPNGRVREAAFAKAFLQENPMVCVGSTFYTVDGAMTDETVLQEAVYQWIHPYTSQSLSRKVTALIEVLRLEARKNRIPIQENRIHLANGTFSLRDGFTEEKQICRHRLPVVYNLNLPEPTVWLSFLEELLEPEDIDTLQEYMGYCLVPSTRGQKMLTIVGNGGEGKSRIGVVMKAMLGSSMATGSLAKVEMSPFARADLENLLVFVDDDLQMEALPQTNHLKTIITADTPMDLERKYAQSYQRQLHVRFLAFGNSALHALHDKSQGFFRRQLVIRAKPRREDRIDDPFLSRKLIRERDSIFLWALEGLYRLLGNNFRFTVSLRSQANLQQMIHDSNHLVPFLQKSQYVTFDYHASVTSRDLYQSYRMWCEDNSLTPLSTYRFHQQMADQYQELGLSYTNNIPTATGTMARGYRGLRLNKTET